MPNPVDVVTTIGRVGALALAMYAYLIVLLRLTGNRTLAKLRAFDFVVTIAIGSLVASTVVTGSNATLVNGITGVTVLIGLQWLVAYLSVRSDRFNNAVTSPPRLLYYGGRYVKDALREARITEAEVHLAMRGSGYWGEGEVRAVILETNGEITVLPQGSAPEAKRTTRSVADLPPDDADATGAST